MLPEVELFLLWFKTQINVKNKFWQILRNWLSELPPFIAIYGERDGELGLYIRLI